MEDTNNKPNKDSDNRLGETQDINKNDSSISEEIHNNHEKNINENQYSMNTYDIKLKEEEENKSDINDSAIAAKISNDEEIKTYDSVYDHDMDTKIDSKDVDDKDAKIDSKDVDDKDVKIDSKDVDEKDAKIDSKDVDDKDAKIDSKDVDEKDVCNIDDKDYKYSLRKRHSIRYTFDEPSSKKKKNNETQEDEKTEFECPICYVTHATKRGLSIHMVFHKQPQKYTCFQCTMEFLTNKELIDHKKVHETDNTVYSCEKCRVAYSNVMEFLIHKADHNYRKPVHRYHCEECGKVFRNRHLYTIHVPTHYVASYKCDVCHKEFKSKSSCARHMKEHEDDSNSKYVCGECNKDCKNKKNYVYHMSSHTGVKLYQCLYCGKGFSHTSQRKVHTRIHTGEKPYECNICKQTFRQSTDHHRHMLNHHNPIRLQYICDYCGKVYKQKPTLAIHMRIHTRKNLVSCPLCNKKFPLNALLKSHYIYNHTDDTPFKCDICKVSFKKLTDLQKHLKLRKHSNTVYGLESKKKREKV